MRETKSITPPEAMAGKPKYKVKHDRRKENLNLYIWIHPRNLQERTQNKNTLALAEKIRFEREQAFLEDRAERSAEKRNGRTTFSNISKRNASRRDSPTMSASRLCRPTTVSSVSSKRTPRYSKYDKFMHMETVTPELVIKFADFLRANGKGEGPNKMYHYFKRIVLDAIEDGLMRSESLQGHIG